MLKVKLLSPGAKLPTVGHPGDDLGMDLYALEDTILPFGVAVKVRTGISARFVDDDKTLNRNFGLLIEDRSSMADKGIKKSAGVIDAGFTGELKVILTNQNKNNEYRESDTYASIYHSHPDPTPLRGYLIKAGDKIAQMRPTEVFTQGGIIEVETLETTSRGEGGFGSTGSR